MKIIYKLVLISILSFTFINNTIAQRGIGEMKGLSQQGITPEISSLSGVLVEVKSGACENTTGKSQLGTHLIIYDQDLNINLNVHLGPEAAVDHIVAQLTTGNQINMEVFRTDGLPSDAYIAKSIHLDDKTIHLRDDRLRPSWAYNGRNKNTMNKKRRPWGACW